MYPHRTLNVFLGALVLMTGQIKNLTFMFTIIANSVIGIIQELKVKSLNLSCHQNKCNEKNIQKVKERT